MYQNDPMKVLTGEVRLSYAHLTQPYANPKQPGAKPKYSVTLLIPKTDVATKMDIEQSIEAAAQDAVAKKWGGFRPPQLKSVLHDGDGVRQDGTPFGEECRGHWVMTASSEQPPQVVGMDNINCQLAPQDITAACMHVLRFDSSAMLIPATKASDVGLVMCLKHAMANRFRAVHLRHQILPELGRVLRLYRERMHTVLLPPIRLTPLQECLDEVNGVKAHGIFRSCAFLQI